MDKILFMTVPLILFTLATGGLFNHIKVQAVSSSSQDSVTVLMDGKTIPPKGFIHLYDSTPSTIMLGHVAAHLPCDDKGDSAVKVVAGVAPNVLPLTLTLVEQMSAKGTICMYHTDLPPKNETITDIALLNPTEKSITLPDTTSVVIHVSEFGVGTEH
jgi:hypothetical protein